MYEEHSPFIVAHSSAQEMRESLFLVAIDTCSIWCHHMSRRTALYHEKSSPAVCSAEGQQILVALSAGEMGAGDGP